MKMKRSPSIKKSVTLGFALLMLPAAVSPRTLLAQLAPSIPISIADREKALNTLFDEIWQDQLKHQPEFASSIGDKRYDDQLTDYSVAAYDAQLARGRSYIEKLSLIDPSGLPDQTQLSLDLMLRQLIDEQEESRFKTWEIPVNQMDGIHADLPRLVRQISFDKAEDYDRYVSRLNKVPVAFQQITEDMSAGIDDNRTMPKYLMEKVLVQVNAIANQKPEETTFAAPLKKFPAGISAEEQKRIQTDVLDAISKQVIPTYARFAKYLTAVYIPKGRTEIGVSSLPDGDAYYAFCIRQRTTTKMTAGQIHQIGIDQVKQDETEMLAIAQKLGYKDIPSLRAAMNANPKLHPTSGEELLSAYRGYIDGMKPKLPALFGRLPKAPLTVEAVPAFLEKDSAFAYYEPGTPDGKRPGTVFISTYKYESRLLSGAETTAYHEGLPGHHLQVSVAQELSGLPEFRKYINYTAYVEGWGLYAERLGKDVGLYTDPYSDFGRLEADMHRAIRLVVDTGIHSEHWTREQVVDYFHAHSGLDEATVQSETDRYVAMPGQALGYKIGQLKLLELRSRAQQTLGAKFDIKAFHDQVIDSGALPLDVLETRVDAWIAQQKAGK
ncbi:protein of unknown function DUF885 [Acidisarcina polymorpha]|uniref:DUF885 domain-containing protein n=1 Tax=Acidisarcina polymorpha TaxID=2211140 RepID=A0A2Z5FWC2_9BACT|nr:DUF885 domain-containing protein [Acidisarcina polymorpha]AXC10716.1 protein of unknown function DUF885 [Acidisarcina polymorpha]